MPHNTHPVVDKDRRFSIDAFTRAVTYQSDAKLILGQYDHNSERFTFDAPRYIEEHDMSKCNKVRIHFINVGDKGRNSDVYEVDDLQVCSEDDQLVTFSWLVSQNATRIEGSLNFVVELKCLDENDPDIIEYSWHSTICTGIKIAAGMDNGDSVVEQYSDVLERWLKDLKDAGLTSLDEIEAARQKALNDIQVINPESTVQAITEAKAAALKAIDDAVDVLDPESAKQAVENAKTEALDAISTALNNFNIDLDDHAKDPNAHPTLQQQVERYTRVINPEEWEDLGNGTWRYWGDGVQYSDKSGFVDSGGDTVLIDLNDTIDLVLEQVEAYSKIYQALLIGGSGGHFMIYANGEPAVAFEVKLAVLRRARTS